MEIFCEILSRKTERNRRPEKKNKDIQNRWNKANGN